MARRKMNKEQVDYLNTFARLDIFRQKRTDLPEFIFAQGKPPDLVLGLLIKMAKSQRMAIATRVDSSCASFIESKITSGFTGVYYETARVFFVQKTKVKRLPKRGRIGIIAAGTSDIPVAEEARVIAGLLGCEVSFAYDVGAAGLHRLKVPLQKMIKKRVRCLIVVAGMDGVLPTIVKSVVDIPVIGVPVSSGYGYGGKGEAALKTMLQSCSPGLLVVNIDNGVGAACAAYLIVRSSFK